MSFLTNLYTNDLTNALMIKPEDVIREEDRMRNLLKGQENYGIKLSKDVFSFTSDVILSIHGRGIKNLNKSQSNSLTEPNQNELFGIESISGIAREAIEGFEARERCSLSLSQILDYESIKIKQFNLNLDESDFSSTDSTDTIREEIQESEDLLFSQQGKGMQIDKFQALDPTEDEERLEQWLNSVSDPREELLDQWLALFSQEGVTTPRISSPEEIKDVVVFEETPSEESSNEGSSFIRSDFDSPENSEIKENS